MAEFVYGLSSVIIVVVLLSSLMLKRSEKSPEPVVHVRSAFGNILNFLRNHVSAPEYRQQD